MVNRDRMYFPRKYKEFNKSLKDHDIKLLGLDTLSNLELFKLAVAFGLEEPMDFDSAKEGLFHLKDIKTTYDQALFNVIKLGVATNDDEIDEFCDLGLNYDEAERCACTGFGKLRELVESTTDEELLIKKMFRELETLYLTNVKL